MDYIPRQILERALRRLGRRALADRLHAMRALADVRGVRYLDDRGRARTIDVALKPWILTSDQLFCFHWVAQLLSDALLRLAHLHARVPAVRQVVRFEPEREAWMRLAAHPRSRPLAVLGRLDSTAIFDQADWRAAFRMLEPNAVGVGGVHYAPAGCSIALDVLGDVLAAALPGRAITATPDPRQLLLEELRAVATKRRRPLRGIALIENTDFTTGTDEFQELARYFQRAGLPAVVADPRDLRVSGGSLRAGRTPVDLLYRDSELAEFVDMERGGARLTALRQAIREGRLISGLTWEFDQKSSWEIFTDARYAQAFTREQRRLFREHLLWTRLVREDRVSDSGGRMVDLPAYIARHQARLVLKPNALFGGEGVLIGSEVSRQDWARGLSKALRGRERYVVQERAKIPADTGPALTRRGGVAWQERHVVSGFFFSSTGVGLVGRFSRQPVVNVSRGGGLIPALWVH
ncbi:MAG: hypothetical protein A3C53_03965 [Omnitrophica WOR_2 bacterium RIFCSPHIGHO2_02_FULL_68_15]|nr:MAG: hypothetical protein A3C53_03965 [Omnitrophica WOR_2 bacterium RIFCSPHIGHO2_02_FULL_68_15]